MGKQLFSQQCAEKYERHLVLNQFTADDAETIQRVALFNLMDAVSIDLSEASANNQNKLLSVLENNESIKFFLHSDDSTTHHLVGPLVSRCAHYKIPLLPVTDIYVICREHGMGDEQARLSAAISWGRPSVALSAINLIRSKTHTQKALFALKEDTPETLDDLCRSATSTDLDLLRVAVYEIETGQYSVWLEDEVKPLKAALPQVKYVLSGANKLPHIAYSAIMYTARLGVR